MLAKGQEEAMGSPRSLLTVKVAKPAREAEEGMVGALA